MPSFDIVSELDAHEVTNAVDQANREGGTRFDFKGTDARFEQKELVIELVVYDAEMREGVTEKLKWAVMPASAGPETASGVVKLKKDTPVLAGESDKADVIGTAVHVMRIVTGEVEDVKRDTAKEHKRRGGLKGGRVRVGKLSQRRRREIAKKAAEARWKSGGPLLD